VQARDFASLVPSLARLSRGTLRKGWTSLENVRAWRTLAVILHSCNKRTQAFAMPKLKANPLLISQLLASSRKYMQLANHRQKPANSTEGLVHKSLQATSWQWAPRGRGARARELAVLWSPGFRDSRSPAKHSDDEHPLRMCHQDLQPREKQRKDESHVTWSRFPSS